MVVAVKAPPAVYQRLALRMCGAPVPGLVPLVALYAPTAEAAAQTTPKPTQPMRTTLGAPAGSPSAEATAATLISVPTKPLPAGSRAILTGAPSSTARRKLKRLIINATRMKIPYNAGATLDTMCPQRCDPVKSLGARQRSAFGVLGDPQACSTRVRNNGTMGKQWRWEPVAGRREEPLSSEISPAQRQLAQRLRDLRKSAGLTHSELSEETGYSAPSLSRVLSGARLPKKELLSDLLRALNAGPDEERELLDLWSRAHIAQRQREVTAPDDEESTSDELQKALDELRISAGRPSVRRIAEEAYLSPTTVHRVFRTPEQRPDQVLQVALTLAQLLPPEVVDRNGALIKVQKALNRLRPATATEQDQTAHEEIDRGVGGSMRDDGMIRVEMPDGTPVWARVSGGGELAEPGTYSDIGSAGGFAVRVENLESLVTGVAGSLAGAARAARPDEVSVQFGIELASKAGRVVALLADGSAKSAITITLTWQGRPSPEGEGRTGMNP